MKNKSTLLVLALLTFGLCQQLTSQTLNGYWSFICYSDIITGKQDCMNIKNESETVSLEFKDNGKIGKMSGHTYVNIVDGDYTISENNKIKVKNFGGTKVGELYFKYDFWHTISQSSSFKFNGDTLVILYDNDTKAMKFIQLTKKK
jgi:hypothetical protein